MTFSEWVSQEKGRAASIAVKFGVTRSAVSQWRNNGVPFDKIRAVHEISGGVVTIEEMLPPSQEAA